MGVSCLPIPNPKAGRAFLKKALWVRGVTAPVFSSIDQLSPGRVPSRAVRSFCACMARVPMLSAKTKIDFS